ncbi:unnamed protein product [Prorocentrum cordatum]|uniref:AFG1-like ATPase n=1 Tax=Prorocentrum cordatum TaxID=2364126 RepID=A0ABN9W9Z4_9DINO|nr:unnamed protein product [Polarella glacialis]
MHGVHRNLHELRKSGAERTTRAVARGIAEEVRLLAFDEFQITNISDALIVETLMDGLFAEDVAVVMTSNRQPEELYKDGLNRHLAIPQLLSLFGRRGVSFHELAAARDFRVASPPRGAAEQGAAGGASPWRDFFCKGAGGGPGAAGALLRAAFVEAAGAPQGRPATVPIAWGRSLDVGEVASGVGLFSFRDLCGQALNADDYLSIARQLHTVVVADVPCFTLDQHDEARRFTNLIDCLYESHARLVVSADGPPERILSAMEVLAGVSLAGAPPGARGRGPGPPPPLGLPAHPGDGPEPAPIGEAILRAASGPNDAAAGNDDANTGTAGVAGVMAGAVGSLQESGFAARRATSRLLHMQSGEYLQAHRAARLTE